MTRITATALGFYAQRRLLMRKSYVAIAGRGYRPATIFLGRWRWVAAAVLGLFVFIAVVLPFVVMVMASFQSYWAAPFTAFTLDNYRNAYPHAPPLRAFKHHLFLATVGAFVPT